MSKKDREEELKLQVKRLEAKYSALQVVPIISKIGQDQQGDIAAEGEGVVLPVPTSGVVWTLAVAIIVIIAETIIAYW